MSDCYSKQERKAINRNYYLRNRDTIIKRCIRNYHANKDIYLEKQRRRREMDRIKLHMADAMLVNNDRVLD